jgi:hypothetical protein
VAGPRWAAAMGRGGNARCGWQARRSSRLSEGGQHPGRAREGIAGRRCGRRGPRDHPRSGRRARVA